MTRGPLNAKRRVAARRSVVKPRSIRVKEVYRGGRRNPPARRLPRSLLAGDWSLSTVRSRVGALVSRQAIAAVLAREDLAGGERLVAFSLASFAGRGDRAWPGAPAAPRGGAESQPYLHDRDRLVARGLVVVEEEASGRGRASTLALRFVATRAVVGGRDQRRAVRGGPVAHDARSGAAAAGGDGRARRRGRRRAGPVERGALRRRGSDGSDLPSGAAGAARVRRAGAGHRRRRAREQ